MAMSTFQKVTLATCLVLCVALLLPKMLLSRGKKDADRPEGTGRFPPMHRQGASEGKGQRAAASQFSRAHNTEAIARAKGAGPGTGMGGKSNLAGQIIPIYGFGILLYILYILFKITSKGGSKPTENRFPTIKSENTKRKITDFELAQLQERLRETEIVMENIVSDVNHSPDRMKGVSADQEECLLLQLREIARTMQEGHLLEDVASQKNAHNRAWQDYLKEFPQYCPFQHERHSSSQAEPDTEKMGPEGDDGADGWSEKKMGPEGDDGADGRSEKKMGPEGDDGADGRSEKPSQDMADSGEAEESNKQNGEGRIQDDLPLEVAKEEKEVKDAFDLGRRDGEGSYKSQKGTCEMDLGVAEEDLQGVLQELELTLKMTRETEQEKTEDLHRPAETSTSSAQVRRRNKRRKGKKDLSLS